MREHLDIAEFETRTKIRAKYLRALEDEEWGLLPGYTFTKAFLRTYADMLGLDGRTIVDEFKRQFPDPSEVELSPSPQSRRDSRRPRERPGERNPRQAGPSGRVLAIALAVVVIAAAVFVVRELTKKGTPKKTSSNTTSSTTTSNTGATGPSTPAPVALRLVALTAVHVCLIGYPTPRGTVHQRVPPPGSTSSTALLSPGSRAPVYHDDHFRLSVAGGRVRMTIGHKAYTIDASAGTRSYEIGHSGRHLLAAAQAPHCK